MSQTGVLLNNVHALTVTVSDVTLPRQPALSALFGTRSLTLARDSATLRARTFTGDIEIHGVRAGLSQSEPGKSGQAL